MQFESLCTLLSASTPETFLAAYSIHAQQTWPHPHPVMRCDHWPEYALASFLFTYCRIELVVVTTVTLPSLPAVLRVDHGATCCLGPGCISLMSDAPGAGKNTDGIQ
jgi:hypothetical protein